MKSSCSLSLGGLLASLLVSSGPAAASFDDALVQPPETPTPERGSVGGSLAAFTIETGALARGSLSLPLDIATPDARGKLLADVFPTYRFEEGLTEWGMGFAAPLSIQRFRPRGDIDYTNDDFTSPWGRLRLGADGHYYVRGFKHRMRIERRASSWLARTPDGTEYLFDIAVQTAAGTYAWYLTRVRTLLGDETHLSFVTNTYGRPFLSEVTYGARGHPHTYRIQILYDLLPHPIEDYRPRAPHHLDRRVRVIEMQARSAGTGGYATRWRYQLSYDEDPIGPAYYLTRLQRVFASGVSEPPQRFYYDSADAHLRAARHERIDPLMPFIATVGATALQPDFSASIDLDLDGRMDLEHRFDQRRFRQGASGWVEEALPPNPQADPRCRGTQGFQNPVRRLHRPNPDSAAIRVIAFSDLGASTGVVLCDELGNLLDSIVLGGRWSPSGEVRFVDVNRDRRPDLLRVFPGGYGVRFSQGSESRLAFSSEMLGPLQLGYDLDAVWAHDLNGDHLVDLFARVGSSYFVYSGLGGGMFSPTPQPVLLQDLQGRLVTGVASNMNVTFVDANRDGLEDFLLTDDFTAVLLSNRGHQQVGHVFRMVDVPALFTTPGARRSPIVGDFRGQGETEVLFTSNTGEVYSVALTAAGTGLLASTSDGKGNTLVLLKSRAPAFAGARSLPTVLDGYELDHGTGLDGDSARFFYQRPVLHSTDHHLIGFEEVGQHRQKGSEVARFHHDDDDSVLTSLITYSAAAPAYGIYAGAWAGWIQPAPGANERYLEHTYQLRSYQGIAYRRLASAAEGFRGGGGDAREETLYRQYDREFCPSEVEVRTAHGTVTWLTQHARVAGLPDDRHCLTERLAAIGRHPDPRFDFSEGQRIERNSLGQATRALRSGGMGDILEQDVTYDALQRIQVVREPSGDWVWATYDPSTGLVSTMDTGDGVSMRVAARDPLTDAVERIETSRGGAPYVEEFAFDGFERLAAKWRPSYGSSGTSPESIFTYGFPSDFAPGFVSARTMVAPGVVSETLDLVGGHGKTVAQVLRVPQGWSVRSARAWTPESRRVRSFSSSAIPFGGGPAGISYADIVAARFQEIALQEISSLGLPELDVWHDPGVSGTARTDLQIAAGRLLLETDVSGVKTYLERDARGATLSAIDGLGYRTDYLYDAMGRLVEVRLPSGARHTVDFDEYGRVARVHRDGVGEVQYAYDHSTNLLASRVFVSATGRAERVVRLTYDGIGRLIEEAHEHLASGLTARHTLDYDGSSTSAPGQLGFLSRLAGPDYEIEVVYNPDTSIREKRGTFGGIWEIQQTYGYFATRDLKTQHRVVRELSSGRILEDTLREDVLDPHGRLQQIRINGVPVLSLTYDTHSNGLLRSILYASGGQKDLFYDDGATLEAVGSATSHGTQFSGAFWHHDHRGRVARETISAMGVVWDRVYDYSDRDFLVGQQDSTGASRGAWDYDPDGLPIYLKDDTGARSIARTGATLVAGAHRYLLDDLGRVVQRDSDMFDYGPSGRIETAHVNGSSVEYTYERLGERILKRKNGSVVAAYLDDAFLSHGGLVEPIRVDGHLVGLLSSGVFEPAHADRLGSIIVDEYARSSEVNPYGVRPSPRTPRMEALDYVGKGYDPDLQTIRMGFRDYDPHLGQFWTPDPLFLEDIDRCVESPVDCNLYGYARNNPLSYTDPSGLASAFSDWVFDQTGSVLLAGTVGTIGDVGTLAVESAKGMARDVVLLSNPRTAGVVAKEAAEGFHDLGVRLGVGPAQIANGLETGNRYELATGVATTLGAGGETILMIVGVRGGLRGLGRGVPCRNSFAAGTPVWVALELGQAAAIESLEVGDRLLTHQGQGDTRVDDSWKVIRLVTLEEAPLEVTLLRPADWVAAEVLEPGELTQLLLGEGDLEPSWVKILAIEDFAGPPPGPGRVVLSTFKRSSSDVYELSFVEGGVVLRGTGAHPLFSLDRQDWAQLRDLRVGERLQTAEGAVTIAALDRLHGVHRVYNLEVEGDHEYLVGEAGVRAHNCGKGLTGRNWSFNPAKDVDMRGGASYRDGLEEAFRRTGVPRDQFEISRWGRTLDGKSIPVEYRGPGGAQVNLDIPSVNNVRADGSLGMGPHQPHIGYQTPGKGASRVRGHIFVDDVPATR